MQRYWLIAKLTNDRPDQTAFIYRLDVFYAHQSVILFSAVFTIKYLIPQIIKPHGTLCWTDDA